MSKISDSAPLVDCARITAVVGHFGSGKTEFSLNLAMAIAETGHPFALADLDIVNPYFRSRELREMIVAGGGRLIASSQGAFDADMPSLPPEVNALFDTPDLFGVLDIGGDPEGARVLARYRPRFEAAGDDVRVLAVVNANRPLTSTAEKAEKYIRDIEAVTGLTIGGIVNNTHLCGDTEMADVIAGAELAAELSERTGIPVVCHAVSEDLVPAVYSYVDENRTGEGTPSGNRSPEEPLCGLCRENIFPMKIYMKKPWEV